QPRNITTASVVTGADTPVTMEGNVGSIRAPRAPREWGPARRTSAGRTTREGTVVAESGSRVDATSAAVDGARRTAHRRRDHRVAPRRGSQLRTGCHRP